MIKTRSLRLLFENYGIAALLGLKPAWLEKDGVYYVTGRKKALKLIATNG